mgnify:CR=1 FL=1
MSEVDERLESIERCLAELSRTAEVQAGVLQFIEEATFDSDFVDAMGLAKAAKLQASFMDLHAELDAVKSHMGKMYDRLRFSVTPKLLDDSGMSSAKVDGVGTIVVEDDIRLKVLDREAEFDWLMEIGSGDLIQETINAGTLKALVRRRIKAGEAIPDSIFAVVPFSRTKITHRVK